MIVTEIEGSLWNLIVIIYEKTTTLLHVNAAIRIQEALGSIFKLFLLILKKFN